MSGSLICVGTVREAHGLRGEIKISFRGGPEADWLTQGQDLHLQDSAGVRHQFKVQKVKPFKAGYILTLVGLTDRTAAEKMRGWTCWLDQSQLVAALGEPPYLGEIIGFLVRHTSGVEVGEVVSVLRAPQCDLLQVRGERGVVEIPFVKAYVSDMNFSKREMVVEVPEEFLDPSFWQAGSD